VEYDPFSQEFQSDPFPVYRWMRDEAPVFYSEKWNWWALSRFEDVRAAATDPQTFLSYQGIDIDDTAKDQSGPGFLPDIDNPRHDQIRRMIQPQLLPNRIGEREGAVRRVVRELIDVWRDRGTVDLAQELAWPTPNEVFFDLLGLPTAREQGRDQLNRWIHELKDRQPDDSRLTPVAKAATAGIQAYFIDLLHERRARPRADLVTHLVTADIDRVPFADADFGAASEVLGLMMVLFLGGVESTSGLIGTLFKLLAEHPDQRAILRENPALIPDAVEEAIRLATPLQLVGRTTSREVSRHGVTIPAGGRVVLVYGAANRDERRFRDPDRFDVTRGRFRHLGFGEGMHGCLGAPLARLEAKVALEEGLPALGDYTITAPPERYRTTPNMYVWDHLNLAFPVAGAAGRHPHAEHVETVRHGPTSVTVRASEFETDVRVERKEEVADGVVALTLCAGGPLPPWTPGAHVDLILDGVPTRQYSLCGDPADHHVWRLGVLRDAAGGGGSRFVHDRLRPGDTVRVRGPRNNFELLDSPRYRFVAGGIGITPVLPMIAAASAAGADWQLLYGGRRRASMAFLPELARYGDRVTVAPQDETGLLDLDAYLGPPQPGTLVYCCGPEPLLAAVEERCRAWPPRSLRVERFSARPLTEPVRPQGFDVELARSELTLAVPPDRSILDVIEAAGVGVLSSCAEGTCGTCETAVLGGLPDHRDSVLTEEERQTGDCMMICVSRSCTARLVLDL
jgi:cytochrome P450/ferredoxin-NADP reductase